MKRTFRWGLCVLPVVALMGCGGGDGDPAPQTTTSLGTVVGVSDAATVTYNYLGIPFAKSTAGEQRWKAPVPVDPWTTPLAATKFGEACLQHGRIYGPGENNTYDDTIATSLNTAVGSEDCLNLNIWRPATDEKDLPVIVFFYGGSNVSGYNADPAYNGANLAKKANAVVVSANYRVGIMGWLRLPQLQTGDAVNDSGNFGTLDTIEALKFVKAHIDDFGGDPDNVTIWGHSAGAVNVFALMASPLAKDLFHRAVPMSGGATSVVPTAYSTLPSMQSTAVHEGYANRLLQALVIDHAGDATVTNSATATAYIAGKSADDIAAFLRGLTPSQIIASALKPRDSATVGLTANNGPVSTPASPPIPEGTVIPVDVIGAFRSGNFNNVPVMVGNARDEGKLFGSIPPITFSPPGTPPTQTLLTPLYKMSDADRFMAMKKFDPNAATPNTTLADQISAPFLPINTPVNTVNFSGDYNDWTQIYGRVIFTDIFSPRTKGVAAEALDALKTVQPSTYYFQFDWDEEPAPWNDVYGAAHGFELPFFFGQFDRASLFSNVIGGTANEQGRMALSDAMLGSLAAFARTGNPNHAGLDVTWEPWPKLIHFDADKTQTQITIE